MAETAGFTGGLAVGKRGDMTGPPSRKLTGAIALLQYDGVLVYIVPSYILDDELAGWLSRQFTNIRIFRAADTQFKQVVIFPAEDPRDRAQIVQTRRSRFALRRA